MKNKSLNKIPLDKEINNGKIMIFFLLRSLGALCTIFEFIINIQVLMSSAMQNPDYIVLKFLSPLKYVFYLIFVNQCQC